MVKIVNCVLAICIVFSFGSGGNALIDDVIDIIHVAKELSSAVLKAWDIFESTPLSSDISLPISREKNKKILNRIKELSRQIDATEEQVGFSGSTFLLTKLMNLSSRRELTRNTVLNR